MIRKIKVLCSTGDKDPKNRNNLSIQPGNPLNWVDRPINTIIMLIRPDVESIWIFKGHYWFSVLRRSLDPKICARSCGSDYPLAALLLENPLNVHRLVWWLMKMIRRRTFWFSPLVFSYPMTVKMSPMCESDVSVVHDLLTRFIIATR